MGGNESFWCNTCNVPLLEMHCDACGEAGVLVTKNGLKPLMPLEEDFIRNRLENYLGFEVDSLLPAYRSGHRVYWNGKPLLSLTFNNGSIGFLPRREVLERRLDERDNGTTYLPHLRKAFEANATLLERMEEEACDFVSNATRTYNEKEVVCSFSGGKDSSVTAYLCKKVLGDIRLLFSNTSIELPETVSYVREFSKRFDCELLEMTPPKDFFELVKEFGPPSRVMRWCCFTQKSAPINDAYRNFKQGVLSFDGIRKAESRSRTAYPRTKRNTKIVKQMSAYPILEWADLAVWLYMLSRGIPLNPLYLKGYSRIGCWTCPNNDKFSDSLTKEYHPKLHAKWRRVLFKYARTAGKDSEWVNKGEWRKRRVKYEYAEVCTEQQLCGTDGSYLFKLREHTVNEDVINFLKVFGKQKRIRSNGKDMIRVQGGDVSILTRKGGSSIKATFSSDASTRLHHRFRKQLEKALNCRKCGACMGTCAQGAISVDGSFIIDETRCTGCLVCTQSKFLKQACAALHYKRERNIVERPNPWGTWRNPRFLPLC